MDAIALIAPDEPLWISTLRERCDQTNQTLVAKVIGYSNAVVNQVLKGTYKGDLKNVEKAVRGAYLGATVSCPVLGEVPANRCLETQRQPYAATNRQRVQLYRACRAGCINSQLKTENKS